MLQDYIEQFLHYCQVSNFTAKSIEGFTARIRQFDRYCQTLAAGSIAELTYQHPLAFVANFEAPSVHVKKNRIWALHQFYHFLKLNQIIDENIAAYIPYPKIGRKVPQYLTAAEFNQLLEHFACRAGLTAWPQKPHCHHAVWPFRTQTGLCVKTRCRRCRPQRRPHPDTGKRQCPKAASFA